MTKTLILYSSINRHTLEICQTMSKYLEQENHSITLCSMDQTGIPDVVEFDKIIIGASIRYGKHRKNVSRFILQNKALLDTKICVFFSVNLVARKLEKNTPESNPYIKNFLTEIDWQPTLLGVFAGKVDYQKYHFFDRHIIQLIMWMTKGPTALDSAIDYTDWDKVESFTRQIQSL